MVQTCYFLQKMLHYIACFGATAMGHLYELCTPFNSLFSSSCFAASPNCRCGFALPDIASKTQAQQDLWIQCDDCDKWRELSASQFAQVQVTSIAKERLFAQQHTSFHVFHILQTSVG